MTIEILYHYKNEYQYLRKKNTTIINERRIRIKRRVLRSVRSEE